MKIARFVLKIVGWSLAVAAAACCIVAYWDKIAEFFGCAKEKLAEKIGVSTVFVSQLESGSRAPGLETLVKLSQTLHVSLDLLVLGGAPGGDAEACLAALVQGRSPRQRMLAVSLVRSLFAEMDRLDAEPPEC